MEKHNLYRSNRASVSSDKSKNFTSKHTISLFYHDYLKNGSDY